MSAPAWLTARPIAHRGLHARENRIIENTLSAAQAAIERGFSVECDVQLTGDGEALVFHDFTLERLTNGRGEVGQMTPGCALVTVKTNTHYRVASLPALLDLVGGRTPLVIEIKSRFDGDWRLAERVAAMVAGYDGPIAIKSFDPRVIAHLRDNADRLGTDRRPLGIVAQARYDDGEWSRLPAELHAKPRRLPALSALAAGLPFLAGGRSAECHSLSPALATRHSGDCLDRAPRRSARPRGAMGRPDRVRGLSALTLPCR